MKKNRCTFKFISAVAALFLFFVFFSAPGFSFVIDDVPDVAPDAVSSPSPIFHDSLLRGIELISSDQYEEALVLLDTLQRMYPDHPAPYFFKAATYQDWMSSFRTTRFQEQVEENVQLAIEKGNELLKRKNDAWVHFYIGAAYGYRAFNRFRKHNWIGAYMDGRRGINQLKKAMAEDPNLYDVYLGLGSYHYWRTARSKFISAAAFWMKDKREVGLRQLEFAMQHGLYSKEQAAYNLIAAYMDYGQHEKAMEVVEGLIQEKNTPSISDLYYKARLLIEFERWPEVEAVFGEILKRLEGDKFASIGYLVECKYWIAAALRAQNKGSEALQWTQNAIAQSEKRNGDLELESPFEDYREIENRLKNLHSALKIAQGSRDKALVLAGAPDVDKKIEKSEGEL